MVDGKLCRKSTWYILKKFWLIFSIYSTDIMKLNKIFLENIPKINENMSTQNLYIVLLKIFIKW